MHNSPTILIVVEFLPLFLTPSVTLQVCTPASRAIKQFLLIVCEEELEAKQLLHVEDQR